MKILIIEDEPLIRRALMKMIQSIELEGFKVQSLTDVAYAEDAVSYLEEHQYDIILVDIEGGEMNGLTLIDLWRQKTPETQWIIVSGYDRFEYAQKAILYGVKEYLLKPVTKERLTETIESCVKRLEEKQTDYIGADEIEDLMQHLEQSIWTIDRESVQQHYDQWTTEIEKKSISVKYYSDVQSHMLETLFKRIKQRGSKVIQAFQWEIQGDSWEEAYEVFLEKCFEMIKMLEYARKGNEVDPIEMAKHYILEHIEEDFSLNDVADRLGFNSSYFSQIFKQETGETFVQFRTRLRMEKAKEILLRKDVKVIDIPFMIGLNDHPHFTKTFKKHTGYTPSQYRRKMGVD